MIKINHKKKKAQIIQFESHKKFQEESVKSDLDSELLGIDINNIKLFDFIRNYYQTFTIMHSKKNMFEYIILTSSKKIKAKIHNDININL